jgi:hypothetical protein
VSRGFYAGVTGAIRTLAVGAVALAPHGLAGQETAYPPLILQLPASTRALAMGNVGVAGRDDDVLFYDPAQLVVARGTSVSMEQFSSTARAGALSSVSRLNSGGIAVGATIAEFESAPLEYPVTRVNMLAPGSVDGTSASLVIGIGQVIKGTRVGGAAKYVEERIGNTRNGRAALDLGVERDVFGYAVGLAVQNIGRAFDSTVASGSGSRLLPLRATLGMARGSQAGPFDVAGTVALSIRRDHYVTPAGGGEIGYSWLDGYSIALRAGARRPEPGERPITAGAGFTMDRLSFDYALESLSGSRVAHRFGLRVR